MSMYRKEWDCCGDVSETNGWEPDACPFCPAPPSPSTAPEVDERAAFEAKYRGMLDLMPCAENDSYMAYSTYCAWRAWKDRGAALASRPRIKLDPELKAALEEAAKTGATSALLPDGGAVFINRGHDYGDNAHLECTACGGSGHIDDQRQIALASRPAEVDDEGLLSECKRFLEDMHAMPIEWTIKESQALHQKLAAAEQYRQGQRDAVAADRARRGAAGEDQ